MKFGITGANTGRRVRGADAIAFAQMSEQLGFESLWTVEHTVVPAAYESQYPYDASGRMPGREESPIPDPLMWLGYVAGHTSTIKLATGILILPQRNPLTLAKEVATLDVLTGGGRLILGIGVGWLREEFDALGIPFEDRGKRTDEYVEALRTVWRDDEPTFQGKFASFEKAKSYPKPVSNAIPIHVGGHSEAAARRAGRLGDGFFPYNSDNPEETVRLLDVMRSAAKDAGRDPADIECSTGGAIDLEGVKRFADAGIDRVVIPPLGRSAEDVETFLKTFSEHVIAKI